MDRVLLLFALACYLAPVVGRWYPVAWSGLRSRSWSWLGLGFHVLGIVSMGIRLGRWPIDGVPDGLAALSLAVVVGWIWLRRRPRMELVGTTLLALAVVLLGVALLLMLAAPPGPKGAADLSSVWFPIHATLMLVGFAGFALSFTLSLLYLVLRRRLKRKRLEGIGRLPSLDTLDRLNTQAMSLGFVTLTAGMAIGALWAKVHADQRQLVPDITIYATSVVWLWYAAGLHARLVAGWRGRVAAIFGVVGFAGLALLIGTAMVVFNGWHGFGVGS